MHPIQVRTCYLQPWPNGVFPSVFGGDQDHVGGLARDGERSPRLAGGDRCHGANCPEGLADTLTADQEINLPGSQVARGEPPGHGL
jgi:hypothetical protein